MKIKTLHISPFSQQQKNGYTVYEWNWHFGFSVEIVKKNFVYYLFERFNILFMFFLLQTLTGKLMSVHTIGLYLAEIKGLLPYFDCIKIIRPI